MSHRCVILVAHVISTPINMIATIPLAIQNMKLNIFTAYGVINDKTKLKYSSDIGRGNTRVKRTLFTIGLFSCDSTVLRTVPCATRE